MFELLKFDFLSTNRYIRVLHNNKPRHPTRFAVPQPLDRPLPAAGAPAPPPAYRANDTTMRALVRQLFASTLLCLAAGSCMASDIVVVVSSRSPLAALRMDQVAALFLSQEARFPDGSSAVPLDQPVGTALRDQFYQKVTGKTPAMLKAYWSKMVFTGRGQPARDLPGSAAVRKAVAGNPAMIGYIDRDALDDSVRPVLVIH